MCMNEERYSCVDLAGNVNKDQLKIGICDKGQNDACPLMDVSGQNSIMWEKVIICNG